MSVAAHPELDRHDDMIKAKGALTRPPASAVIL